MTISEVRCLAENGRRGTSKAASIPQRVSSDLSQQTLHLALVGLVAVQAAVFVAAAASDKIPFVVLSLFRALVTI